MGLTVSVKSGEMVSVYDDVVVGPPWFHNISRQAPVPSDMLHERISLDPPSEVAICSNISTVLSSMRVSEQQWNV
jgi:hypothetical protein